MANPTSAGMWYNADGLQVKFPQYQTIPANFVNRTRSYQSTTAVRSLSYYFDLTKLATGGIAFTTDRDNSGTVDGFNEGDVAIPGGSGVLSVYGLCIVPFVGGTNMLFDLYELDGSNTTITNHSIFTSTNGATATWNTQGRLVAPDGVIPFNSANYVGADAIPATRDAYLAIKANGTFTAGTGLILINYIPSQAELSSELVGA